VGKVKKTKREREGEERRGEGGRQTEADTSSCHPNPPSDACEAYVTS